MNDCICTNAPGFKGERSFSFCLPQLGSNVDAVGPHLDVSVRAVSCTFTVAEGGRDRLSAPGIRSLRDAESPERVG